MCKSLEIIEPLSRKAFMAIAEECKKHVSEFRKVTMNDVMLIRGILVGRSGEKYDIRLIRNRLIVEWGINSVIFDDYDSVTEGEQSEVEKLYDYMDDNITHDDIEIETDLINALFREFGYKNITREEYMRRCTSDELADVLTQLILSDKRYRMVRTSVSISKDPNYEMKMWLKGEWTGEEL